ncbi:MAG: hypothetical protein KIT84_03205 [Labilithrix sp.]|nr:hypothetical protein [Labilithrix sp.]MCW5809990.1 hypothetical protein [Labilithrix sp.]
MIRPLVLAAIAMLAAPSRRAIASGAPDGWRLAGEDGIRGFTIGPIENGYHPGVGYGSPAYGRTLDECRKMGARWIALTPFGRVSNLEGSGVDPTFEKPFRENREDVRRAIRMARERGLRVMLVPHLWVESGDWRAKIDPPTEAGWEEWTRSYEAYVTAWAEVAEESGVDLFSAGVELRSWVTTAHAPSFAALVRRLRKVYRGPITYSANWDDADHTLVWSELDVIGINAFYPLADKEGSGLDVLLEGGKNVRAKVHALAEAWQKPVLFTEVGYTTRPDPAVKPWLWPEEIGKVPIDEHAQADAYRGLLAPLLDEPYFMGFFVWRLYADPDDVSQEPGFGFSPRGKQAELVVRDAFATTWATDAHRIPGWAPKARVPGIYP